MPPVPAAYEASGPSERRPTIVIVRSGYSGSGSGPDDGLIQLAEGSGRPDWRW